MPARPLHPLPLRSLIVVAALLALLLVAPWSTASSATSLDVVLSGHDHAYARWAPRSPEGDLAPSAPRQLVVGTGGGGLRELEEESETIDGLEYHQDREHGVLRLELEECAYQWQFVTVAHEVLDEGRGDDTCRR